MFVLCCVFFITVQNRLIISIAANKILLSSLFLTLVDGAHDGQELQGRKRQGEVLAEGDRAEQARLVGLPGNLHIDSAKLGHISSGRVRSQRARIGVDGV